MMKVSIGSDHYASNMILLSSSVSIFVSVCSKMCLCVLCVQKWTQTDTKVTFQPPTRPPENFFWSQMKDMAKIRLFYSGAMALILPR